MALTGGRVKIYSYDGNNWTQLGQNIDGEARGDESGYSVSLAANGKTVAIGADFNDGNGTDSGHVRVYKFDGTNWSQLGQDIDGEVSFDYSGFSVSLAANGKTVAIGTPYNNNANGADSGQVRIYTYTGSNWIHVGQDIDGESANDLSGSSVSLSGDGKTVAIGGPKNDGNGPNSGHVRIYNLVNPNGPIAKADTAILFEDSGATTINVLGNDTDADGDQLTVTAVNTAGSGTVAIDTKEESIIYTPAANFSGTEVITYTISDGTSTSKGILTVSVTNLNDTPIAQNINSATEKNKTTSIYLIGTDSDNDNLIHTVVSQPANGKLSLSNKTIVYTPNNNFTGTDTFTYKVNDGSIDSEIATVNILVFDGYLNLTKQIGLDLEEKGYIFSDWSWHSMTLSGDGKTIAIGQSYGGESDEGSVTVYNYKGSTWSQLGQVINGKINYGLFGFSVSLSANGKTLAIGSADTGVRVYTYTESTWSQTGNDIGESFWSVSLAADGKTLAIGDTDWNTNTGLVRIYSYSGSKWSQLGQDIKGKESNDKLGYSVSLAADGNTIAIGAPSSGANSGYVQVYNYNGSNWIQLGETINGEGNGDEAGWSISLAKDGKSVAIGAPHNDGNGANAGHVRVYTYVNSDWVQLGQDIDRNTSSSESGYSVSLAANGKTLAISAIFNDDEEKDAGQVRVYTFNDGKWTQIGENMNGGEAHEFFGFTVALDTGGKTLAIGSYSIPKRDNSSPISIYNLVNPAAPNANQDTATLVEDSVANIINVVNNDTDTDGDLLKVTAVSTTGKGKVTIHTDEKSVVYTPEANFSGTEAITYVVSDGTATAEGILTITVTNVNDNPIVQNINTATEKNTNASIYIPVKDNDLDDTTLTIVNQPTNGSISTINDTFVYTPNTDFTGTDTFTYQANDDSSSSNIATVTIDIFDSYLIAAKQIGQDINGEAAGDISGTKVAISANGKIVAISATANNGNGEKSGHVRVYTNNGSNWSQLGKDIDGKFAENQSGTSIALAADGKTVAIGAIFNDDNERNSGYTRIYTFNGNNWEQLGQDINGDDAFDFSGYSVALDRDGETVAIGAINPFDPGHVRIYTYKDNRWSQLGQDVIGEAYDDWAGYSVSLAATGRIVAIGATRNAGSTNTNLNSSGHVRIYAYKGGTWLQLGQDIDGEDVSDESGYSVSLAADGKTVAIGARYNNGKGTKSGHVRVYTYKDDVWSQLGQDIDGEAANDWAGYSTSLAADGKTLAVGAHKNDGNGTDSGHVRIYDYRGSKWVQVGQDIDGEAAADQSGQSVSLAADGKTVVIGAPYNDGNGTDSGHARVFNLVNHSPTVISDIATLEEDSEATTFYVLDNDTDIDGDPLKVTAISTTGSGTVAINTDEKSIIYTPLANFYGTEIIAYTASDNSATSQGTLTVTVTNVNDIPVAQNINSATKKNDATSIYLLAKDKDDDSLSYIIESGPGHGILSTIADGSVTYTPNQDFTGTDTFTYKVNDGFTDTNIATVTINVFSGYLSIAEQLGSDINGEDSEDLSGRSVSLSADGNTLAVGAVGKDSFSGYVRIYRWDGASWNQLGSDIDGEASLNYSGDSVSLSADGNTLAIGAPGNNDNGTASGHVRIYGWDGISWNQLGNDIDGEDSINQSGYSVSLSADGKTLAVGAPFNNGNGSYSGHVRIYEWEGASWNQLGSDIDGEASGDMSGGSVSLSADGNTLAIGGIYNNGNGSYSDYVRIYGWDKTSWNQLGSNIDGEASGGMSGGSVSLSADGNTLAIGTTYNNGNKYGHVRIYEWNGTSWDQLGSDISGESAGDLSGKSVSLSADGNTLAIGAHYNDDNGISSGHVRIFGWDETSWNQLGSDIDGEASNDYSGESVSLSADGKTVAIGARYNSGNGSNSGHVRVYNLINPNSPVANADIAVLFQDSPATTINVVNNDTDADGDQLTVTAANTAGSGTIAIDTKEESIIYTPAANFSGTEVITYSISDGAVNSIGTLTVTVLTKNPMKLVFDTTKDNASYSGSGTITEDDTTNTKVSLPLGGAKDVYVDWGDGTSLQKVTTEGDIDYIYSSESTYTVKIYGTITSFGKENSNYTNVEKLTRVESFGDIGLTNLSGAFREAQNLTYVPNKLPEGVVNTSYMFAGAKSFNADIGEWIVDSVKDMSFMFASATSFNQDITGWNVGNVVNMREMFSNAKSFNQNIGKWDVQNVVNMRAMFLKANLFNQDIGGWNTNNANNFSEMFAFATSFNQDIGGWDVGNVTTMEDMFEDVTLSTTNYDALLNGWAQLDLKSKVRFHGGNSNFSCGSQDARDLLTNSKVWIITDGSLEADTINPTITPPENVIVNVDKNSNTATNVALGTPATADNCTVVTVTNNAQANFPVGDTTVTWTVTDGSGNTATATQIVTVFPPITDSNFNAVITECLSTNPVDGLCTNSQYGAMPNWDVSNVTNMYKAFEDKTSFNADLSNWDVSNVTNMTQMFWNANSFNQDISNWNVSNVNDMFGMFYRASAFNQDIGNWNVNNVTDMSSMFYRTDAFNQDIGNWNVSNVTKMKNMFYEARAFNQDLSTWNVSNVTTMSAMFALAISFNQDIGDWNVSKVTNMSDMFWMAISFNQDLSNWNVSNVTDMSDMFAGVTLSTTNYDALLNGWAQLDLKSNVQFHGGSSTYSCASQAARTLLINKSWRITDGGLEADTINPTITAPDAISVNVDTDSCEATNVTLGNPTTADNCTVATTTNDAPTSFPVGETSVTWTVTDGSGNTATATQIVTVIDNIDPSITAPVAISVNVDADSCEATNVTLGNPTTADNCTLATTTNDAPTSFPVGETTVTWTVTDASGNTATATQIVTVVDNIDPSITAPVAISVNIDAASCSATNVTLGTPTTSDNCSVATTTNDAPASFPVGETTVTWTVTDASGNTATATQVVTVVDNIDPSITAPVAISVNIDAASCSATNVTLGTPTTSDNCSVATTTNDAPASFPVGETTVTWTVTDASGNTATATQVVTVVDNIDPSITAPVAISVNIDAASCSATNVTLGTPTTSDNCSVATTTNDAPASFPVGETTVTWTVTDASGNTATATQVVTVVDNFDPTISAPVAISVNVDAASCSATNVALGTPTISDNCSVTTTTNDAPTSFLIGETTVTWMVTDGSGNTATATQVVTVVDNINPTISAPVAISVNVDADSCSATNVALGTPTTSDNCSVATTTNDAPTSFPIGETSVTWMVTDASGNTAYASQLVTVVDNIDPTILAQDITVQLDANGTVEIQTTDIDKGSTDNCGILNYELSKTNFRINDLGQNDVIYTVTDVNGNKASKTVVVTVTENALAVEDFNLEKLISIYPNPTTKRLSIYTDSTIMKVNSIQIFSINGKEILIQFSNNNVDVKDLAVGVYVVKINTDKGSIFKRFLKIDE